MSMLDSNGFLLTLGDQIAGENCADACGCGGGPVDCRIVQLTACQCADTAFVCLPDGYLSCQPEDGPPEIGTVVRIAVGGVYAGRCWTVADHWDEWPDFEGFLHPPLVYLAAAIEPVCRGGCDDGGCVDYSGLCPPSLCGWEMCNGWQDWDPDSCGYIPDGGSVRVDEVLVVATAQINLFLDAESIAGPGNTVGAPAGAVLERFNGTLAYNLIVQTRFRFIGGAIACVSNSMYLHYRLDAVLDRPYVDPEHQHVEIDNDYELNGSGCPIPGPGSPTVSNPCNFPVAVLGAAPPECGIGNECLFARTHDIRELMCGSEPVGASTFWDRFWQITRASCAGFEEMGRYPYTCDETYTLEETHTTVGSNGCGVDNDTIDTLRIVAWPWQMKKTSRNRNEQLRIVNCVSGPGGLEVSSTDTSNYQWDAAVQQRVVWSRCVEGTEAFLPDGGRHEGTEGGEQQSSRPAEQQMDARARAVLQRMLNPCATCGDGWRG